MISDDFVQNMIANVKSYNQSTQKQIMILQHVKKNFTIKVNENVFY